MKLSDLIIESFSGYLTASRSSGEHSDKELKFYASDMGKCLRMRWLKRKGIKGEYGFETYYNFAHGDFIHKLGYKALEAKGILVATEQSFSDSNFSGRYDGKLRHDKEIKMFDFKSANPYVMKRLVGGGSDNLENIMQVLVAIMYEKKAGNNISDVGAVIYVNKLPSDKIEPTIIETKEYHLSTYEDEIKEDMDKIVDYWMKNKIPPCTCPSWSIQKYNSFYMFCKMTDKEITKHLDYLKAGKHITSDGYAINIKE